MSALDAARLRRALADEAAALIDELEVFASIASTNTHLLARTPPAPGRMHVALADHQTSGRGRHAKRWNSPPGAGLYLSLAWTFAERPQELAALTLAIGLGVHAALTGVGAGDLALKWPNDLVARDRKLGGVLTEVQSGRGPAVTVVTGVGINVRLPDEFASPLDGSWAQAPIDLAALDFDVPAREDLAAAIILKLAQTMTRFGEQGFAAFATAWEQADWLRGRQIRVERSEGVVTGTAAGTDASGALIVDADGEELRIISGSITLAPTEDRP